MVDGGELLQHPPLLVLGYSPSFVFKRTQGSVVSLALKYGPPQTNGFTSRTWADRYVVCALTGDFPHLGKLRHQLFPAFNITVHDQLERQLPQSFVDVLLELEHFSNERLA